MGYGPLLDGLEWQGSTGRTWLVNGDDLVLWMAPTIMLLGNDPQRMIQDRPYQEYGAEAEDANGVDLTVNIDATGLDTTTPGSYFVIYTAIDSYSATATVQREVIVLDADRPFGRDATALILEDALPDGVQVYATPPEQVKTPAVVVGTMEWSPVTMNSLEWVRWRMTLKLLYVRSMPEYGIYNLETFSLKVAKALVRGGYRVPAEAFSSEGTETVGGQEYLVGTLAVDYETKEN